MVNVIRKCFQCGTYSLRERCACGEETKNPKPMKYSPDDSYASYRRKAKEAERKAQGLV
ncbi:ribosome biogenesis protein [Candidatus Woesearchaeota archaeon]|nr:ribosome biogenesis protein [Candidatus Woesearchaeota archaeon]